MKVTQCDIGGLLIIEPKVFGDARGFFLETWNEERYREAGLGSRSRLGTLRGLHFQNPRTQGKLVWVIQGEVLDVAVDLRRSSPTFGHWHGVTLSEQNRWQFFVPAGFAHAFAVVSETALFAYKCTDFYSPKDELTLRWDEPEVGVQWPVSDPVLSEKDRNGVLLRELPAGRLF